MLLPPRDLFGLADPRPVLDSPPTLFADVVFDRPLDHAYTYAVPAELHAAVVVGKRVEVPFGKGDKFIAGYCVRVCNDVPPRPVKAVRRVLDDEVLLSDHLLRLTRWMADYYLCGWGQVLHAVVPAGARDQAGIRENVLLEAVPPRAMTVQPPLTAKQGLVLKQLRKVGQPLAAARLAQVAKVSVGVVMGLVGKGYARRVVQRVDPYLEPNHFLASRECERPEQVPPVAHAPGSPGEAVLTLNPDQERAWAAVRQALTVGGFHAFLLHGVTGSGKTEIYLRAIEEVVRQGKEAIVLVPEISLTPQTIERFRGRCDRVAVLHSHLTDAERGGHWRRIAAGMAQVVVGARSAVFAPTRQLGLIVIDEEHETSFKQESTPRYHARDVAVMRARLENVPIVMGSATPALESWHNAQRGQYTLLNLPKRVAARPLPGVGLIDLRHEPRAKGRFGAISPSLEQAMKQALAAGGQVMLFLNRRGFATHVHCPDCGAVATCQNCDLALTFHRQRATLMCHYCGFEQLPIEKCPQCGKPTIKYQGLGTEKLQAEVEEKFPGRVVQRMDSDTMGRSGSHARVFDAFKHGLINVLLGTQMIAKGLDFPNVTLVGVINADTGLHVPDFRAAERTFQLLAQVAGRTGRGEAGGRVVVQTYTPDHPSIALAAMHDFVAFAQRELEQRKLHNYPPYHRIARLIIRSEKAEAAAAFAETLAGAFQQALRGHTAGPPETRVRLLGPAEAPVFKLNNYFRFHFQLQSASPAVLHQVLREVLAVARPPAGVEFQVDVDPFNML